MSAAIPPRIHVLLAREAPFGVVIRRGPSKSVCTIGWDLRRNTFELGQWMRGRIYERRTDLSPDGRYLIYFAMNGRWGTLAKGSWTAISRAPYLKAIAMFPKGDCWHGGGLFTGNRQYWLNEGYGHETMLQTSEVRRDDSYAPDGGVGGECLGVYYPRLLRDGWRFAGQREAGIDVFEKPVVRGWFLRKLACASIRHKAGRGCYWDEHELVHPRLGTVLPMPGWEWAEVSGTRLVWAESGTIRAGRVNRGGLCDDRVLADFNDMKFQAVAAPY